MLDDDRRLRLAVVGAGNIAPLHLPGYLDHPRCEVVTVCDPVEGKARALADQWGIAGACTDLAQVLDDPGVDAVEILTPTHLHAEHVLASLGAGKHVSCQKPIANTVEEAMAMADAATGAGLTLRVSECFRHYPPLVRAKELVESGAIGRLTSVRIRTVVGQTDSAFQTSLQPEGYVWRLNDQSPGGHLFDDMIHKYAMALWLGGQAITSVQAVVRRRDLFFEPCAAIFEYEDDLLLGSMEVSYAPSMWMRSSYYGADEFFELQGDEGFLWVTRCTGELLDLAPVMLYRGPEGHGRMEAITDVDADWAAGFTASAGHFVDSVLDGGPAVMTAEEAIAALQLCFAVYHAGNTGTRVDPRTMTGSVVPEGWAAW
jgi:predicted dehydrogenase